MNNEVHYGFTEAVGPSVHLKQLEADDQYTEEDKNDLTISDNVSYTSLINWNIAKVLQKNPAIDLKGSLKVAQDKLDSNSYESSCLGSQSEDQYLSCAVLAWKSLGESDTDRLYEFVKQNNFGKSDETESNKQAPCTENVEKRDEEVNYKLLTTKKDSHSTIGPVIMLPKEPVIVMRVDSNRPCCGKGSGTKKTVTPKTECAKTGCGSKAKQPSKDKVKDKVDQTCCTKSACAKRLSELDASTAALQRRAIMLGKREAERMELLQKAEAAWTDLEQGYQRRLRLAEEKEEALIKQIKKLVEDRNNYKNSCSSLAQILREKGNSAEAERKKLADLEKALCESACTRHRLSEDVAKGDACYTDQQCRTAQLERDFQIKEEQAHRKMIAAENSIESAKTITFEMERAMRADMTALQEEAKVVSKKLLDEHAKLAPIKRELDEINEEKAAMIESLEACKVMCDGNMQAGFDELKKKKQELYELKERVLECRCKLPVDASIEVKRTPSLAALCRCSPEDRLEESCSCTSLRTSLLSNLLCELFGGLQSELGTACATMPCQLLKCLEDRHNWDKATNVKIRLRDFFSKLLLNELDIAIATSIENYHAKWIGATCADRDRFMSEAMDARQEVTEAQKRMQERAIEYRARELATKLADQLFRERAEKLAAKRAKEILEAGPAPCECAPPKTSTEVYSCLLQPKPILTRKSSPIEKDKDSGALATYWSRTHKDVSQLRTDIEILKKDSIKKEDLKTMERKLARLVQKATETEKVNASKVSKIAGNSEDKNINGIKNQTDNISTIESKDKNCGKIKTKINDLAVNPRNIKNNVVFKNKNKTGNKSGKGQTLAVNICLCADKKDHVKVSTPAKVVDTVSLNSKTKSLQKNSLKSNLRGISSVKNSKLIVVPLSSQEIWNVTEANSKLLESVKQDHSCEENCVCFNKVPSNTSIHKFLNNLMKKQVENNKINKLSNKKLTNSLSYQSKINCLVSDRFNVNNIENIELKEESLNASEGSNFIEDATKISTNNKPFPKATESEYMRSINLEKSSENAQIFTQEIYNSSNIKDIQSKNNSANPDKSLQTTHHTITRNIKKHASSKKTKHLNCDYDVKFLGITLVDEFLNDKPTTESGNTFRKYQSPKSIELLETFYNDGKITNVLENEVKINNLYITPQKFYYKSTTTNDLNEYEHIQNVNKPCFTSVTNEQTNCVCCNANSKDLEENTFQLLNEHFKKKLKDFQSSCCQANCIQPEDETKMLTSIFSKVKTVISDNIGKLKCKCPHETQLDNSWNRAYTLLQEYLKVKMKRVQCHCNNDPKTLDNNINKDLHEELLTKICNLIESDFDRIKCLCTCKHVKLSTENENRTNISKPIPEKNYKEKMGKTIEKNVVDDRHSLTQTKISKDRDIKENFQHSTGVAERQDVGAQSSENRWSISKSCSAVMKETKNTQTIFRDNNSFYPFTPNCDCSHDCNHKKNTTLNFFRRNKLIVSYCPRMLKRKKEDTNATKSNPNNYVSCNYFTNSKPICFPNDKSKSDNDESANLSKENYELKEVKSDINNLCSNDVEKPTSHSSDGTRQVYINTNNNGNLISKHGEIVTLPYIGYTVDCSCDIALGSSICRRAFINANNELIQRMYDELIKKQVPVKVYENENCSKIHIKQSEIKGEVYINNTRLGEELVLNNSFSLACETIAADNDDEFVLKGSRTSVFTPKSIYTSTEEVLNTQTVKYEAHTINNKFRESVDFLYQCKSKSSNLTFENCDTSRNTSNPSLKFTEIGRKRKNCGIVIKSSTESLSDTNKCAHVLNQNTNCECNKVPLCHVNMLIENIERLLLNRQCTCKYCSKVCPVHKMKHKYSTGNN